MNESFATIHSLATILLVVGVTILVTALILAYAMIRDYQSYLEDHWRSRYSFADFVKRERFYIYLFLGMVFVMLQNLWYLLEY